MSEDDDNFLGGIIEFGDGRQYTVQSVVQPSSPPPEKSGTHGDDAFSNGGDGPTNQSTAFVSKEERFGDDFDRSWPRSKSSSASLQQDIPVSGHQAVPPPPAPVQYIPSAQETSRVLFNERSNKLEPYSNAQAPFRSNQGAFGTKRGSHSETTSPTDTRSGSQAQGHNVQLLQKSGPHPHDSTIRPRGSTGSFGSNPGMAFHSERPWGGEPFRREVTHATFPQQGDSKRNRDHYSPFGPPPLPVRDRDSDMRAARSVTTGPLPFPPVSPVRGHRDNGRQPPPHLSPSLPSKSLSAQDPQSLISPVSANKELCYSPGSSSSLLPAHSPLLSQVPLTASDFASPNSIAGFPDVDIDEVRRDVMQSAAARAKERRKREEDEREKEKERARRKAAELEARMRAAEAEKHTHTHDEVRMGDATPFC